ncbi:PP2C family protein-serine/threonine phosphatase [Solicola sp. PLA-1-18]|uniref:PP2C family protein-serine/threonine phosphatase n=1 Tax=Solicola sp. PLA-1-18 TaxID=3380532 RepID=UPI003B82941D
MSRRPEVETSPRRVRPAGTRSLLDGVPLTTRIRQRLFRARLGTSDGQRTAGTALCVLAIFITIGGLTDYNLVPLTTFLVPILLGTLLLRMTGFVALLVTVAIGVTLVLGSIGVTTVRTSAVVVMAIYSAIALFEVSRRRSGLPSALGEDTLNDLRDRILGGAVLPELPRGWRLSWDVRSADAADFAGDFLVATLDDERQRLEVVLVDVSGKGVDAGTRALQLSGAFGGLLGAVEPERFLRAANAYVMRQRWLEGFATAVHLEIDLPTGAFVVRTAGHPPALQWHAGSGRWTVHESAGPALGLVPSPEFVDVRGRLRHGDAIVTYTDGMVETPDRDYELGIDKLLGQADRMVLGGFADPARTLLDAAGSDGDDRGVAVLHRG